MTVIAQGPAGVNLPALRRLLNDVLPVPVTGELSAELIAGGRSNLTYLVRDEESVWVLRRPPIGHVLATAHDMAREFRVLSALQASPVPVPRPLALAEADVLDAPCLVMEFVEGTVYRAADQFGALGSSRASLLADNLADVLARLHALDPADFGLADFGRPVNYLDRQIGRWKAQLRASQSRDMTELTALGDRLAGQMPAVRGANGIVHGDYRLDNVIADPVTGQIVAVLDWEMSTLGDTLVDLASLVLWWDGIAGLDHAVAAVPGEFPGFPGSDRHIARYAAATGADISCLPWYVAFAFFKMATIFEGIHYRHVNGWTVGDGFERLGAMVPHLVERGHDALSAAS
jgi:aminoglycoside phosphotransferase (APT) family kinase protein